MKLFLLLTILIISLYSSHATPSAPQIQEVSSSLPIFWTQNAYYSDGLYYFTGGNYYNITSGQYLPLNSKTVCSPFFTLDVEPFCITSHLGNSMIYSLLFLTPNLTGITAQHEFATLSIGSSIRTKAVQVDQDYISIGLYEFSDNKLMFFLFELSTQTFICSQKSFELDYGIIFMTLYSNGSMFVYGVADQNSNYDSYFVTGFCSNNQTTISPGPNNVQEMNLFAFNGSNVFVNNYVNGSVPKKENLVQVGVYNSSNQLNFGPAMQVISFVAFNDTHMFIDSIKNGVQNFGLFVISPALEFVKVASFNFGSNVPIIANPLIGTNQALLDLGSRAAVITYDFNSNSIIQVATLTPTITLSNSSTVNTSQYGYFIQSPDEPIYFIQAPFSNEYYLSYQNISDSNQTYTLFVPSLTYNYSKTCLLTHFNASSSVITQTTFPSCPLTTTTGNPITIKDVKFASDGTPYVCYRDAFGSLFIVNTAGSLGPFEAFYTYTTLQVSMNSTNGTANFAGTQLTSFVLGRFNITSGAVLTSHNLAGSSLYNTILKVAERFYLLAFVGSQSSLCAIYDMNSFSQVYQFTTNLTNIIYNAPKYQSFGILEENPSSFSGIVFIAGDSIFVVNNAGNYSILNVGPYMSEINDIVSVNETSFTVILLDNVYYYTQLTYEIVSWGGQGSDASEDAYEIYEY